jgi:hypothetical protein
MEGWLAALEELGLVERRGGRWGRTAGSGATRDVELR